MIHLVSLLTCRVLLSGWLFSALIDVVSFLTRLFSLLTSLESVFFSLESALTLPFCYRIPRFLVLLGNEEVVILSAVFGVEGSLVAPEEVRVFLRLRFAKPPLRSG